MRHEACHSPVAVEEWMYPEQPVVSGRHGDNAIDST
jgi:hypothetical protein